MKKGAVVWLCVFAFLAGILTPTAYSAASTKTITAGKLFRPYSDQGFFTASSEIAFSGTYLSGSTRFFSPMRIGAGVQAAGFGFAVRGGNLTLDYVEKNTVRGSLTVPVLGTAKAYVYAPGYYTPTVVGADSWTWNDANKTVIVSRASTGAFTVSWSSEADSVMWDRVFPDSYIMLGLLAIVTPVGVIVYYLSGGDDPIKAAQLVALMATIGIAAIIIAQVAIAL